MKSELFEQKIKEVLDSADFRPPEDGWLKMEAALKAAKEEDAASVPPMMVLPKRRRFNMAIRWSSAAMLMLSLGLGAYFINENGHEVSPKINNMAMQSAAVGSSSSETAPTDMANRAVPKTAERQVAQQWQQRPNVVYSNSHSLTEGVLLHQPVHPVSETVPKGYLAVGTQHTLTEQAMDYQPVPTKTGGARMAQLKNRMTEGSGYQGLYVADWSDDPQGMLQFEDPFIYGFELKAGLPTQGRGQISAGLNMNRPIGERFFLQGGVDVAYTDIRQSNDLYYKTNENGTVTNLGFAKDYPEEGNTELANGVARTTYRNGVLSLGVNALFGTRIGKKFSVAIGGDMYRNLNNQMKLKENGALVATGLADALPETRWISAWDAGLRGQVAYDVNDYLSISTQYRQGLANFIYNHDGTILRNSSLTLGINLKFNP